VPGEAKKKSLMLAKGLTPILNISDMARSFEWFEKLGWSKAWEWGEPPTLGASAQVSIKSFFVTTAREAVPTAHPSLYVHQKYATLLTKERGCLFGSKMWIRFIRSA
jgi:hypothetical protein